jgi:hypothetical protein
VQLQCRDTMTCVQDRWNTPLTDPQFACALVFFAAKFPGMKINWRRISQDPVENAFSALRNMQGGSNNPTPAEAAQGVNTLNQFVQYKEGRHLSKKRNADLDADAERPTGPTGGLPQKIELRQLRKKAAPAAPRWSLKKLTSTERPQTEEGEVVVEGMLQRLQAVIAVSADYGVFGKAQALADALRQASPSACAALVVMVHDVQKMIKDVLGSSSDAIPKQAHTQMSELSSSFAALECALKFVEGATPDCPVLMWEN